MFKFEDFAKSVVQWAKERDILSEGTFEGQISKFAEEAAETVFAAGQLDQHFNDTALTKFKDGIGDTLVTIIIACHMQGVDPVQCLEEAYDVISMREGKMKKGKFVKDEQ